MKLAIVGTQKLYCYDRFIGRLRYHFPNFSVVTEIVSGGAKGTDQLAEMLAEELNIPTMIFLPEYNKYGKDAPLMRNTQIVDYDDKVIAFVDDSSRDTDDTIRKV